MLKLIGFLLFRKCGLLLLYCQQKPGRLRHKASYQMWGSSGAEKCLQPLLLNMSGAKLMITRASFIALPFLFKYYCFSSLTDTQINSVFFLYFCNSPVSTVSAPFCFSKHVHLKRLLLKNLSKKIISHALSSLVLLWVTVLLFFPLNFDPFSFCVPLVTCVSRCFKLQVFAECTHELFTSLKTARHP